MGATYTQWPAKTVAEADDHPDLKQPAPVFHGDTLFAESEVLEVKESQSKPGRGAVKVHTRVFKQDGTLVAEFKRAVLVPRLPISSASAPSHRPRARPLRGGPGHPMEMVPRPRARSLGAD